MTDLSRSQLEKAWEGVQMINDDDPHSVDHIVDAIEAVLSAPTAWWCAVARKEMPGARSRTVHCQMANVTDGSHADCGWVALVPMGDGE